MENNDVNNKSIKEQIDETLFKSLEEGGIMDEEIIEGLKKLNNESNLSNKERLAEVLKTKILTQDEIKGSNENT